VQSVNVTLSEPFRLKLESLRHEISIPLGAESPFAVRLLTENQRAWELAVDVAGRTLTCGDVAVPLPQPPWTNNTLRIFLDASVIETFVVGRESLTSRVYSLAPGKTELQI